MVTILQMEYYAANEKEIYFTEWHLLVNKNQSTIPLVIKYYNLYLQINIDLFKS